MNPDEYDGDNPIHYCPCGMVIGDGDHASGHRRCVPCRRPPGQLSPSLAEQLLRLTPQQVLAIRATPRR